MSEIDFSTLSKKERKKLKREMERHEKEKKSNMTKIVTWLIVLIVVLLALLGGWWVFRELSKPLPGQQVADLGREHVGREKWETFSYNSNPPTSGPHDPTWIKAGVYEQPQGDGHLVHSLEHGYVVISYNCGVEQGGQDCDTVKKQLSDLANDKKLSKLIVVPRQNLDTRIAVTAWTRIDKMDEFDRDRIVSFIDAYRNHGPEQTVE